MDAVLEMMTTAFAAPDDDWNKRAPTAEEADRMVVTVTRFSPDGRSQGKPITWLYKDLVRLYRTVARVNFPTLDGTIVTRIYFIPHYQYPKKADMALLINTILTSVGNELIAIEHPPSGGMMPYPVTGDSTVAVEKSRELWFEHTFTSLPNTKENIQRVRSAALQQLGVEGWTLMREWEPADPVDEKARPHVRLFTRNENDLLLVKMAVDPESA